jgi:hypothetical protein
LITIVFIIIASSAIVIVAVTLLGVFAVLAGIVVVTERVLDTWHGQEQTGIETYFSS